jgi:hypothetical protein
MTGVGEAAAPASPAPASPPGSVSGAPQAATNNTVKSTIATNSIRFIPFFSSDWFV